MMSRLQNSCRRIRGRVRHVVAEALTKHGGWIQEHIAQCPKCRARLNRVSRVELALSLVKTQPHGADLLVRANTGAVNVLKHGLRTAREAEELQDPVGREMLNERCARHIIPLSKTAACLAVVLLLKMGVVSSIGSFQEKGECAMRHYYAKQLDQETADEVFLT